MHVEKDTLNPKDYPDHEDDDTKVDRGDTGLDDETEEEEEEKPAAKKKPAKKPSKKDEAVDEGENEEEEEEEEAEEEDDDETPERSTMVALSVLKKAQAKRRAAEERAKELERKLNAQEETKSDRQKEQFDKLTARMDELYEAVEEARATGDKKEAAKLQRELDDIRGRMTQAQASMHATRQALQAQNLHAYNALVAELEVIEPRFDESADEYDEDLVERVAELTEGYEAKGMHAPDALRKALRLILGVDPFKESRRLARDVKKPVEEKEKVAARKTDVKKNLEAKKKQPPEERDGNKEKSGVIHAAKLSEEDFDKLPKSKLRELRGDFAD